MPEKKRIIGVISQMLLIVSGIVTLVSLFFSMPITFYPYFSPDNGHNSFLISILGLFIFRFYANEPFSDIPRMFEGDFYKYVITPISILGIANSVIFLTSVLLLFKSRNEAVRRLNRKSKSYKGDKLRLIGLTIGPIVGLVSYLILLTMATYSITFLPDIYGWPTWGDPIHRYDINSLGSTLLVLNDVFGGLTIVLIGTLFMAYYRYTRSDGAWTKIGTAYTGIIYIVAGALIFTIFLTYIGVIMEIAAATIGAVCLFKIKTKKTEQISSP